MTVPIKIDAGTSPSAKALKTSLKTNLEYVNVGEMLESFIFTPRTIGDVLVMCGNIVFVPTG